MIKTDGEISSIDFSEPYHGVELTDGQMPEFTFLEISVKTPATMDNFAFYLIKNNDGFIVPRDKCFVMVEQLR